MPRLRLAFVIPWYDSDIPGGAENGCRNIAAHLLDFGFDVEILTTCVKDFFSNWNNNFHKEGVGAVDGVTVRRFMVKGRDTAGFDRVNYKLMHADMSRIKAMRACKPDFSPLTPEEEAIYLKEMINSPALYDYIRQSHDSYDFFILVPYMFGTTYFGSEACGDKSILFPCLHDESYAYMSVYRKMFSRARGVIFNSASEQRLAERLYGDINGTVTGIGVDTDLNPDGRRFMSKYSINGPFILYVGKKDTCKNTHLLVEYFCRFKKENRNGLKLVLMGSGNVRIPSGYRKEIIDLGFMEHRDKFDAYGAALCLCQPSVNESFALVVMEAWAARSPVLVHAGCEVTREFCVQNNGGLYFANYPEFAESVIFLMENPQVGRKMGMLGCAYVKENFSWDVVTRKLVAAIVGLKENDYRSASAAL
ncbi:MAG: glycosyltransferase family 4 protein [Deltaproteobacteria bacterium]|nr:glycosyltransferase family 4 protein [Deltaproteobacteria bacterium]